MMVLSEREKKIYCYHPTSECVCVRASGWVGRCNYEQNSTRWRSTHTQTLCFCFCFLIIYLHTCFAQRTCYFPIPTSLSVCFAMHLADLHSNLKHTDTFFIKLKRNDRRTVERRARGNNQKCKKYCHRSYQTVHVFTLRTQITDADFLKYKLWRNTNKPQIYPFINRITSPFVQDCLKMSIQCSIQMCGADRSPFEITKSAVQSTATMANTFNIFPRRNKISIFIGRACSVSFQQQSVMQKYAIIIIYTQIRNATIMFEWVCV